jgi:hypothetical protein
MTKSPWKIVRIALVLAAATGCAGARQRGSFVAEQPGRSSTSSTAASSAATSTNTAQTPARDGVPGKTRILREVPLEGAFAAPPAPTNVAAVVAGDLQTPADAPSRVIPVDGEIVRGRNPLVDNLLSDDAELRLATLQVIRDAVKDGFDFVADTPDTEGVNLLMTLRWMAYGYEKDGTWVEPVDAIRAAAMAAVAEADPANIAFNRPFCIDDALLPAQAAEVLTADSQDAFPKEGNASEEASAASEPESTAAQELPEGSVARLESGELRELRDSPVITPKTIPSDEEQSETAAGFEELARVDSVPADESPVTQTPTATEPTEPAEPQSLESSNDEMVIRSAPRRPLADGDQLPELNDAPASEPAVAETSPEVTTDAGPLESADMATKAVDNSGTESIGESAEAAPAAPGNSEGSVATDEPRMKSPTEAETARKTIPLDADVVSSEGVVPSPDAATPSVEQVPTIDKVPETNPKANSTTVDVGAPSKHVAPTETPERIAVPRKTVEIRSPGDAVATKATITPNGEGDEPSEVPYVAAKGVVCRVDTVGGTAEIRLYGSATSVPVGTRFVVVHRYPLGKLSSMGEVEVTAARAGIVTVRPVGGTPLSKVAVGDRASTTTTGF